MSVSALLRELVRVAAEEDGRNGELPRIDDPVAFVEERLRLTLDPWQRRFLTSDAKRRLLNCPRQSGKSLVTGALAAVRMITRPRHRVVLLAPTQRQSTLLSRRILDVLGQDGITSLSATQIELVNGSTASVLPGDRADFIRGVTGDTLIIDEAARIKPSLAVAALPIVAGVDGDLVLLSTPAAQSGLYYELWQDAADDSWERILVRVEDVAHYSEDTMHLMRARLGERAYSAEFGNAFLPPVGSVFDPQTLDAIFGNVQKVPPTATPDLFPDVVKVH
jgi:hypothetical protein